MIDGIIPDEIREGPAAIRATIRDSRSAAVEAASLLRDRRVTRIFAIGNGTSRHTALAAAALYARHAGPGDPIVVPLTAGEFRRYRPRLGARDAILGISASGEFADVVQSFAELRGTLPTIGVVHVPDSRVGSIADRVVVSSGGPSRVPVMTKTFSATLVATEMTLLAILGPDQADPVIEAIDAAADHAAAAIDVAAQHEDQVMRVLEGYEHVFVVGAGLAHFAALEAALKLKEIALVHAEGGETWEVSSGAATMLDER